MAHSIAEGKKTYQKIANVAGRFLNTHLYNAGVLLKDERVSCSVRLRKPVVLAHPKSQITSSLAALAAKLSNSESSDFGEEGFFKKVVNWFF
jgi:MinD-like ATPase involved in chromosome partitioning or flagellar assembly